MIEMQGKKKPQIRLFSDAMGLSPYKKSIKQAWTALLGEKDIPRSRFGLSSLKLLYPKMGIKLWRGKYFFPKTAIITNLFNHTQTPIEQGWSVEKTQVKDFRGKTLTYNSHNGTDFAIPVGTTVLTAAPGKVVSIRSEFNRGGRKVFIDHGYGLMTTYAHLAKVLVKVGQEVVRGQPIALSGYSGIDGFLTFPFGVPHVHFNVWLNNTPIDPFGFEGNPSLWLGGNMPKPPNSSVPHRPFVPSEFNPEQVQRVIQGIKTEHVKASLLGITDAYYQAAETVVEMCYYPTRFTELLNLYSVTHPRTPMLDLPFSIDEIEKVVFLDEI